MPPGRRILLAAVLAMSQLPSSKRHLEERAMGATVAGH